ncbi:hypothetical protein Lal_00047330 [Lupinus albus]|uniref:Uncharacterized protein n=1 Tax=Lupinus albus TaxID=3870 RepID=A0A6A4QV76_LUPAL|nr:putative protein NIM1-INTERACTING 2 [Lupinus albus]KAF1878659.1 hypothetical protein Lal_00047330 [Lupinus albus]
MSDAKDKRKHGGGAVFPNSRNKTQEEVTDEEVEEFYAILRRMNTAVKHFNSGRDDVASLEKEITQELKGATAIECEREENVELNLSLSLDLNLSPKSQTE